MLGISDRADLHRASQQIALVPKFLSGSMEALVLARRSLATTHVALDCLRASRNRFPKNLLRSRAPQTPRRCSC